MSLRVNFDESHGEQFSVFNCRGLAYVLDKLKVISFRIISGPITIDKIGSEDVLFLGGPTKKFFDFEIKTIRYFVSKGKFLIVTCPIPIPFDFTLNQLIQEFGMIFQHNMLHDQRHNLNGAAYFPLIKRFQKNLITRDLKEIVYSGCTIKPISPDVQVLAISDEHAEPPSAPIIATSMSGHVICIGGSTIFQDDKRYGIKAKNNIRLVANIFRTIIQQKEMSIEEQKVVKPVKRKPLNPKKAKKQIEKLANDAITNLEKLSVDIDTLFNDVFNLIKSQQFSKAEEILRFQYPNFKKAIENSYGELMERVNALNEQVDKSVDLFTLVKELTDQVLVTESETLSKLDMIRFNLINQISKEKLRHTS